MTLLAEGTSSERHARSEWEGDEREEAAREAREDAERWLLFKGGARCFRCGRVCERGDYTRDEDGEPVCFDCAPDHLLEADPVVGPMRRNEPLTHDHDNREPEDYR